MISIEFKTNPSLYKKISKDVVDQCMKNTIGKTTLEAEKRCKQKAPYKTGALRRGHSSEISSEEGLVKNSMNYAVYVVHGTSKMDARNYPLDVLNELVSEKFMSKLMKKELREKGVVE